MSSRILLIPCFLFAAACGRGVLTTQYEYDEEVQLATDGSAVVYVNGSVPALVALRGMDLDLDPRARVDRRRIREWFTSDVARATRVTTSRRQGRRFIHVRIDVPDVRHLSKAAPFAWSTYAFAREGDALVYRQSVGAPAGRDVANRGWTGQELVAFRMHFPSRIRFHNAPSRVVERGNILVWEQRLSERLSSKPVSIEVRMDQQSILYSTLWLFGSMIALVALTFAAVVWWVMRKRPS
jgi:hypothetical protein